MSQYFDAEVFAIVLHTCSAYINPSMHFSHLLTSTAWSIFVIRLRFSLPDQLMQTFFFNQILEQQLIQALRSRLCLVYGDHAPDINQGKNLYASVEFVQGMKISWRFYPRLSQMRGMLRSLMTRWRTHRRGKKCPTFQQGFWPPKYHCCIYNSKFVQ